MDQAVVPAPRTPGFKKGRKKTGGRQPAEPNKIPKLLKDALIMAVENYGSDGKGKDKIVGFFTRAIEEDFHGVLMLVGRVMPLQIETRTDLKLEITYPTMDDVRRELYSRGIDMKLVQQILDEPEPDPVDDDDETT